MRTVQLFALGLTVATAQGQHISTVATFSSSRAGTNAAFALADGSQLAGARNLLNAGGHRLVTITGELTLDFLGDNGIDTLVLTMPASSAQFPSPLLTDTEADVVEGFVRRGGKVMVMGDLFQFGSRYNNLLDDFGLAFINAQGSTTSVITLTSGYDPLTNGFFGSVTRLSTNGRGIIDIGASNAYRLRTEGLLGSSLVALTPDQLGPGSGHLVVLGDTNFLTPIGTVNEQDADVLWRNFLSISSQVVPAPGVAAVMASGLLIASRRRSA